MAAFGPETELVLPRSAQWQGLLPNDNRSLS
jgi:hypothetical protein